MQPTSAQHQMKMSALAIANRWPTCRPSNAESIFIVHWPVSTEQTSFLHAHRRSQGMQCVQVHPQGR